MHRLLSIGFLGALIAAPPPHVMPQHERPPQEFVVIVHAQNPESRIAREQLSEMFLKRVVTWPDGRTVEPVDLSAKSRARRAFTGMVHLRPVDAVRAFWQQQIFSARDVPPPEKGSEAAVIEFVRTHEGAVGYVSPTAAVAAGVIEFVRTREGTAAFASSDAAQIAGVKAIVVEAH